MIKWVSSMCPCRNSAKCNHMKLSCFFYHHEEQNTIVTDFNMTDNELELNLLRGTCVYLSLSLHSFSASCATRNRRKAFFHAHCSTIQLF